MNLPWQHFNELPGERWRNWELLCREILRRQYEHYGPILTRKHQPGVEFHLKVQRSGSELGPAGRHWGWQCKWFEPDALRFNGSLRSDQRRSIEEAIAKTAAHLPTLTDWVLWTREKLSADDQRWFEALEAPFALHQADEDTLTGMLTGRAEILRQTWFGELVLDPVTLDERWREAIAPIAGRYVNALHIETPGRSELAEYLPDPALLDRLTRLQGDLAQAEHEVSQAGQNSLFEPVRDLAHDVVGILSPARDHLVDIASAIAEGELPSASRVAPDEEQRAAWEGLKDRIGETIDRRHREAFAFAQADRAVRAVEGFLSRLEKALQTPLLAVLGAAGAGKTHLAASLTDPHGPVGGALILGQQFGGEIEDDDLARKAGIGTNRDELLEALEAVGVREGRRIPLVIDGLNESRDPRSWEVALSRLAERLKRLRHVIAIVTLRPSYRDLALPADAPTVEIQGFEGAENEAVSRFFDYYKIEADPRAIEWWRPSEPLLLSIFCRTVNPDREDRIGADDLPGSLHEVFDHYMQDAIDRIAGRLRADPRSTQRALLRLAHRFFEEGKRALDADAVTEALEGGRCADWERSLRFQLEAEGILHRDIIGATEALAWSYDLLGGQLIAKAILARHPERGEVAKPSTKEALLRHPLREDIVIGLTGLVAAEGGDLVAIFGGQEPLSAEATLASARLPRAEIGRAAIDSMRLLFLSRSSDVLDAISPAAFRARHPFNGCFLDSLLSDMEVWRRDLRWTEWTGLREATIKAQLDEVTRRWMDGRLGSDEDAPLAWVTWLLTAPEKQMRNQVIYALYEFGRRRPRQLFSRALAMLGVTDPTVADGILGAGYGVAMSMQIASDEEQSAVIDFADELQARLLCSGALQPTSHWLIREYAYRITQFAAWISDGAFEARPDAAQPPLPEPPSQVLPPLDPRDDGWREVEGAFKKRDLQYYKIGRLVDPTLPWQVENPRLLAVAGEIRSRVADLGFTKIEASRKRRWRPGAVSRSGRYAEKYGWVAYYEAAGRRSDRRELHLDQHAHMGWRIADMPIDPSFPRVVHVPPPSVAEWAPAENGDPERWVRSGHIDLSEPLLQRQEAGLDWIVIDGHLIRQRGDAASRVFCSIHGMLALDGWEAVASYFREVKIHPREIPKKVNDRCYFAGEAPWAAPFDSGTTNREGEVIPEVRRLGRFAPQARVELLGVPFDWEPDRAQGDLAHFGSLPSKPFSRFAGLRKRAETLEFIDPDGQSAARCAAVQEDGWLGSLLLVRKDLLEAYGASRRGDWGWAIWGLREYDAQALAPALEWAADPATKLKEGGEHCFGKLISLADLGNAR